MHLLMLDSNLMGSRNEEVVESIRGWIEEDLSRCTQPVKIAVMHHPMVTVGSSLDDSVRAATMRHAYWETLRRGGISFLLCGHQHLYCRRERDGITQVMGVSGTKYFDGPDLSGMEAVHLFVSNATLFESDGNAVKMTTIDPAGQVLDTVVRSVPGRPEARMETAGDDPARGHVSSSGDGVDAGLWRNARIDHPLPEHRCMPDLPERLFVCGVGMPAPTHLAPSELHRLPHRTAWFSVYRRGRICQQKKTGILLEELLRDAGWTGEGDGLIVSGQKGMVTAVRRQELMTARRFSVTGEDLGAALPMLCRQEDGRLQLVTGQRTCHSYNGKEWIDGVTALEVIDLAVYCQ